MLYLPKMPKIIQKVFPAALYRIPGKEKKIFLTFDDGPIPDVTPWVLNQLKQYKAKATFFWLGSNMVKHPEYIDSALSEGHTIGNHTFHHYSGWKTPLDTYLNDIKKCDDVYFSKLFRPPYGEFTFKQYRTVKAIKKIVLWDVVSYDFDTKTKPAKCLANVMKFFSSGSIIVFHDSLKAWPNLKETLPIVLKSLDKQGYVFESLDNSQIELG